jgi:hypothetical protein
VPDTSEKQKRKAKKLKQQIQWELRSKAKIARRPKEVIARGPNRMVIAHYPLVSVEEYPDGSIHHSASDKMPYRHSVY